MAGRIDILRFGANQIGTPELSAQGTWFRVDAYTSSADAQEYHQRLFAAGKDDDSPMFEMDVNGKYHACCACCWLGFAHTLALHMQEISQLNSRSEQP